MDGSSKGTVMQEDCWRLLTVRIALHSGNAVVPAAGGKSGTWRMCPWAVLLLQPSFTSCFQKLRPRTMTSVLVHLCHCYMASLWALSSNNIEACWESGIAGKGLWCWRLVAEGSMGLPEERS